MVKTKRKRESTNGKFKGFSVPLSNRKFSKERIQDAFHRLVMVRRNRCDFCENKKGEDTHCLELNFYTKTGVQVCEDCITPAREALQSFVDDLLQPIRHVLQTDAYNSIGIQRSDETIEREWKITRSINTLSNGWELIPIRNEMNHVVWTLECSNRNDTLFKCVSVPDILRTNPVS